MADPTPALSLRPAEIASARIYGGMDPGYGEEIFLQFAQRMKVETVRRHLRPEDRVLDVGCGNGLYMRTLAGSCREVTGIDITQSWLEAAQAAFARHGSRNCALCKASGMALPFAEGSFDLVYSFSTLVLVPDIEAVMAEMVRVLKPGGFVVFDISNATSLSHRHWNTWYQTQGHPGLAALTWPEARATMRRLGLEIVEMRGFGLADQLKYWKPTMRWPHVDRLFHNARLDLDHVLSSRWPLSCFANRWYAVGRKKHS